MQKLLLHRPSKRFSLLSSPWLIFFVVLVLAQSAHGQAVKIMPFGTWTKGIQHHASYRYDLWFKLTNAGFDVDFVGKNTETGDTLDLDLYPEYLTIFDRDHEGYATTFAGEMVGSVTRAADFQQPDIVLLWLGSHDIFQQGLSGATNATFAIRDMIEGIRSSVPGVTILLGLTHFVPVLETAHVSTLNDGITTIASELDTPESPIIVVDMVNGFDPGSMLLVGGTIHNRVGEAFVANKWFEVLADIMPDSEFPINAGLNDAWYYKPTSGQGFFITVFPDKKILSLAWFTFDTELPSEDASALLGDAGHRWLTALGPYDGDTANLTIYLTKGGLFDKEEPSPVTDQDDYGTMTLKFTHCNEGLLSYEIPSLGLSGEVPIERVAGDNIPLCETLAIQ